MASKSWMIAASLLIAMPAAAQTAPAPAELVLVEAPSATEVATLAEARRVVGHLLPPGVYKQILGPAMAPVMDSMGDSMKALPLRQLAEMGGLDPAQAAALDKVRLADVMAIYDPHWQERMQRQMHGMIGAMGDFFTSMEPEIREAMARAYANHFTLDELTDLDRFFATPSGGKFAGQYMTIMSDPAMAAEMKSMMPKMMQQMPHFVEAAQKAAADLPPPRKVEDLTPDEKVRLAKALGVDESKLRNPKSTI